MENDDVTEGSGPPRWGFADAAAGYLAAIFASSLIGAVVVSAGGGTELGLGGLALAQVGLWAGFLGAPLVATRRRGNRSLRRDFGLEARPGDALVGIPAGIAAQLVLVPLIYLPFRALLDADDLSRPARELVDRASGAQLVVLAAALIVVAPIVEELFFRGLLLRAWERRASVGWAVTGSSLVFGATHFEPLQLPALAAAGGVFAVLAVRAGRLGPAIWAHAAFNATTVAVLVLGR